MTAEKLGLNEINEAFLENMAFFSDSIWVINLVSGKIKILHDRSYPFVVGKMFSFDEAVARIRSNNHPDENEILARLNPEYLRNMKKSETYEEATFVSRTGRKLTLRCIYTPEFDADGSTVKVYLSFLDIQPMISRNEENEIVTALSRDYLNVFILKQDTMTISIQKLDGYVTEGFDKMGTDYAYSDILKKYVQDRVYSEDKEMLAEALKIETVIAALERNEEYVSCYRTLVNGDIRYFQFKIIRLSPNKILAGFSCIDTLIKEENRKFLSTLLKDYTNIYWLYTEDATIESIKQDGTVIVRNDEPRKHKRMDYDLALRKYITLSVHKEDMQKFYETMCIENVKKELSDKEEFTYIYRSTHDGLHFYQMKMTRVEKNKVLVTFINIDSAVADEYESLKQMEWYNSILDACTNDYKNVYLLNFGAGSLDIIKQNNVDAVKGRSSGDVVSLDGYDEYWERFCRIFVHEEDRDKLLEFGRFGRVKEILRTGQEIFFDYRSIALGKTKMFRLKWKCISKDEILMCAQDISSIIEQEQQERRLVEDALAQAEHASRAKTTFLNNMSHDIRTPMNTIMGYATLASMHITETERVADWLSKIQASSSHLISLLNNVLDMSRIESGKMLIEERETSLPEVLQNIKNIIQGEVKNKQLDLYIDSVDVNDCEIWCDKLRLNQVLLNVMSNAVKYTPDGGTVSLRVKERSCRTPGYAVYEFIVKDNGIGMSEEFLSHVFEPFERERNTTMSGILGTGLGLAITKNIVDMMNGNISIVSKKDKGTEVSIVFTFRLVEEISELEAADEKPEKDSKQILDGLKILLVEDNDSNRDSTFVLLTDLGAKVDIADDGSVAVGKMQEARPGDYDIILMDIQMPVMDGYESTREIRALPDSETANIPIIAFTANACEDERKMSLAVGMNGHVVKPVSIEILTDEIRNVLEKEALRKMAYRDRLTGLYTRNYIDKWQDIQRSEPVYPVSFVAVDCNDLKKTNDTVGHAAGDLLLRTVGKILKTSFPHQNCTVIRTGGDEFLVLCRGLDDACVEKCIASAKDAGKRVQEMPVSFCAGFVTVLDGDFEFDSMLNQADELMMREKAAYHGRIRDCPLTEKI